MRRNEGLCERERAGVFRAAGPRRGRARHGAGRAQPHAPAEAAGELRQQLHRSRSRPALVVQLHQVHSRCALTRHCENTNLGYKTE